MSETRRLRLRDAEFDTVVVPEEPASWLNEWLGADLVMPGRGAVMVRNSEGQSVLARAGFTLLRDPERGLVVLSPGAARILLAEPPGV